MHDRIIRRLSATVAAATLGVATMTATASAHAAPFTVRAGSAANGVTVNVTGTSGAVNFADTSTGQLLSCSSSTIKGNIKVGNAVGGTKVAYVDGAGAVFNGCSGPGGWKLSVVGVGTWYVNITDSTNGVIKGTVSNIVVNVALRAGPTCSFSIGANAGSFVGTVAPGTVTGTYANANSELTVPAADPGYFGLWNVNGSGSSTYCVSPSIFKQGDKAAISSTWTLKADLAVYNPITIT